MKPDLSFWHAMNRLIETNPTIIDRPKGSAHPRYAEATYPFDYGYLDNTTSSDGGGIDVWLGSLNSVMQDDARALTGILCTFDTLKRDAEIKLLVGCTIEDVQVIQEFHSEMSTLYVPNPTVART
jgi:inorganic pyrophosphatase